MTSTKFAFPETTTHLRRIVSDLVVPADKGDLEFSIERQISVENDGQGPISHVIAVRDDPTETVRSSLYEIIVGGKLNDDIIGSLNTETETLFWKNFSLVCVWINKYPHYLHQNPKGNATFFPVVVNGEYLVAVVYHSSEQLKVQFYPRFCKFTFVIGIQPYIVFPQPSL